MPFATSSLLHVGIFASVLVHSSLLLICFQTKTDFDLREESRMLRHCRSADAVRP